jgi:peptide-methionine (R)-S-oxide reductase
MYACAACGNQLFASDAKFDSGTGWPSFDQAIPGSVKMHTDESFGMNRTEVTCANCGSHLGHLFNDGPKDTTGNRFCINSSCLLLKKEGE